MSNEELLEQCLQALGAGQELPPDIVRYLGCHPEQRAEVEDLLFMAQRVSRLPMADLSPAARARIQSRLAERLSLDPAALSIADGEEPVQEPTFRKKLRLPVRRISLARLYAEPLPISEESSEPGLPEVFRDLTPEDIRRYIGVRGEHYIYYRQRFPGWEPIFTFMAFILRGFKRLENAMREA